MIDAIKAVGCLLIVLHHMAFYGPMSDVVAKAWPTVLWALFRVSVETPGIFVMGLVAIPTALAIGVFRAVERVAHWLAPHVSQVF